MTWIIYVIPCDVEEDGIYGYQLLLWWESDQVLQVNSTRRVFVKSFDEGLTNLRLCVFVDFASQVVDMCDGSMTLQLAAETFVQGGDCAG